MTRAHVKKGKMKTTISTITPISIKPIKSVGMQLAFMAANPADQADKATQVCLIYYYSKPPLASAV